jgi:excisionase family DNA binding protein
MVTVKELCDLLGVSDSWVRRQVAKKSIPYLRLGKVLRFDYEAVKASMQGESHDDGCSD